MSEKIKEIKKLLDIVKVTDWSQIGDRVDEIKLMFDDLEKPKRQPLADGTLPLTNGEMSELCEIMGYQNICKIFYDNKLHFKCFDKGWGIITDVKAILYLAERFNLTGEK